MKKGATFFAVIFTMAVGAVFGNFTILFLFNSSGLSFGVLLSRFLPMGISYIIMISIVLGINTPLFNATEFGQGDEQASKLLKKIGAVPIKSIAVIVVLQAAYLFVTIFIFGYLFVITPGMKGFLYSACLAVGMTIGTLVYIVCDGLVAKKLLSHNVTVYPKDLREGRQGLKACIIPMAVCMVSLLFSFSVTVLSLYIKGLNIVTAGAGAWSIAVLVMAGFFVFILILAVTFKKNTNFLYNSIVQQLENLSSGKKNLKQRINIASVDELGTIGGMMNSFCDNIAEGMRDIKGNNEKLSSSSGQLENNAQSMYRTIDRVSTAISEAHEKAEAAAKMLSVDESSAAIHKIAQNIEALDGSITSQASSLTQASAAIEEMVSNIASISKVTGKMADHFETVGTAANEGISIQKGSIESVDKIVAQSQALQAANRIIATISSQTNLLAMNAAIEAAHAGEAGRGFSVVADEIRKLAVMASSESKNISEELKQISKTIDGIVKGTESSSGAFSAVNKRVLETESLIQEVNRAIKEQQLGTEQILEALRHISEISAEVKSGSNMMKNYNNAMLGEIGLLQTQSTDISSGMDKIAMEMTKINSRAGEVSKLAEHANIAVKEIKTIADGFEV